MNFSRTDLWMVVFCCALLLGTAIVSPNAGSGAASEAPEQREVHHVIDGLMGGEGGLPGGDGEGEADYIAVCGPIQIETPPRWMVILGTVFSRCYGLCLRLKHGAQERYQQSCQWVAQRLNSKGSQKAKRGIRKPSCNAAAS